MKKKILICLIALITFGCDEPGTTSQRLIGNELNLPDELKGLKIYSVSTGQGAYVKVALLDKQINSINYVEGKTHEDVILLQRKVNDTITYIAITGIIFEKGTTERVVGSIYTLVEEYKENSKEIMIGSEIMFEGEKMQIVHK